MIKKYFGSITIIKLPICFFNTALVSRLFEYSFLIIMLIDNVSVTGGVYSQWSQENNVLLCFTRLSKNAENFVNSWIINVKVLKKGIKSKNTF